MSSGKTTQYFKYAIGEIVLVVIGILIALSINNWNENRKSKIQELKYLKNLQADLLLEYHNNDSMMNYRWATAKAAAYLLNPKPFKSREDLLELELKINQVFMRVNFIPTNNTYKELISSGNLNEISNDSIKDYLLELDKMYVTIANIEHHMYREYEEYLYNTAVSSTLIINLFDFQAMAERGEVITKLPSQSASDSLIPPFNALFKKKEFINGLRLSVMNNIGLKDLHNKMTIHLEKLNQLIDRHIQFF